MVLSVKDIYWLAGLDVLSFSISICRIFAEFSTLPWRLEHLSAVLYFMYIYIVCTYGTNDIRYAIYKYLFTSRLIFARRTFYYKFFIKEKRNMVNV